MKKELRFKQKGILRTRIYRKMTPAAIMLRSDAMARAGSGSSFMNSPPMLHSKEQATIIPMALTFLV